ncbi:MAG TPA: Gfo/Idh/MocA family oxidoreductase [Anaeromyxobacteraceae bacterium]|nr:Gfo/Idh/MocA family oxidoreductase [Anaeromyxobacteraceae bacterium]
MKKVVWGVLGTARIAREKVIPAMLKSQACEVRAIASRSLDAARAAAAALNIRDAHGSYEALLADPEIEAVYNPLPNHLHVPLTLKAAAAGKHVLCEKPIALTAQEARELSAVRGQLLVAEAFMVRFHPQWLRLRELIRRGALGTPRAVQVFFAYTNLDEHNIRNRADIGGGGLYDIGCYAVVAGRYVFQAEARRAAALFDRDPHFGTDRTTSGLVDFGGGRHLTFTVSTQCVPYQRVQVCGTEGRVELQIPFNAPADGETRLLFDDGSALDGSAIRTETLPACDQYTLQAEAFSRAIRGEIALPYGVEDALRNMRILDALFRSETSGRLEEV